MSTGTEIYTLRGRVARIFYPDKPPLYLLGNNFIRKEVWGKYIIRIEDTVIPEKGWKRLVYRCTHGFDEFREWDISMSVCPYAVGDVVELSVVKILIPSGYYTTEVDRI